jgi:GT2 family glycosyltransferase
VSGSPGVNDIPLVSVVIATYNYSSVLKYALQSVLWQTFQNFEIQVIGDGCTDDSEVVVASFGDTRIHWYNLPENTGNQSIPNNTGIQRARGKYIAYLGHDDLWYPDHLERLMNALEMSRADAAHSLMMVILPESPTHQVYGLSRSGHYEFMHQIPPSSLAHLRTMVEDTGYWKDYRMLHIPPDIEFVARASQSGKQIVTVAELTVFKFPSAVRKNVYRDQPTHEQAVYADRILHERDFRYHELLAAIQDSNAIRQHFEKPFSPPFVPEAGQLVDEMRAFRGLEAKPRLESFPLSEDLLALTAFNHPDDITPSSQLLHLQKALPENGVLIGVGWHVLEHDDQGVPFRWVNTNAELLLTRLDDHPWLLSMTIGSGPGNGWEEVTVALIRPDGMEVDTVCVKERTRVSFRILPPFAQTTSYTLRVLDSRNQVMPNDPRTMNIIVSEVYLEALPAETLTQSCDG